MKNIKLCKKGDEASGYKFIRKHTKKRLVDDTLEVCTFDVFNDKVTKYALVSGKFTISSEDTLTNYLESIKTKID